MIILFINLRLNTLYETDRILMIGWVFRSVSSAVVHIDLTGFFLCKA